MVILSIAALSLSVISIGALIVFRKIDEVNIKRSNFSRYSDQALANFKQTVAAEQKKFQDATIEMDILIKKHDSLTTNISVAMNEIENRLNGLNAERDNLKRVEDNILFISSSAKDVKNQIEYIAESKKDFSNISEQVLDLQQQIADVRSESGSLIINFNNKIRERSKELSDDFSSAINRHTNVFAEQADQINELKVTLTNIEGTVFGDIKEKSDQLREDVSLSVAKFEARRNGIMDKIDNDIEKIYDRLRKAESTVDTSTANLIETFRIEVSNAREEIDNIDLHALTKKDDLIRQIRNEYQTYSSQTESMVEKFRDEYTAAEQRLDKMKTEVIEYEEKNKIFERTDTMIETVDRSVNSLTDLLEQAKKEFADINKFIENTESLKDIRKSVDKEIYEYQSRKNKLKDVEDDIQKLMDRGDLAINLVDEMNAKIKHMDFINSRMNGLSQSYDDLDEKFRALREHETLINSSLDAVSRIEGLSNAVDTKITDFKNVVNLSEKRTERLDKKLQDVEKTALTIKSRINEIQELKNRLDDIDSTHEFLEEQSKQISTMYKKVEGLWQNINESETRLQNMSFQTDEKIKELATFIKSAGFDSIITKQINPNASPGKNINERLVKTVRELHERGWSAENISKKMANDIDESTVRLIINSAPDL